MNIKHSEFILCNDPICEADEAIDYLQVKVEMLKSQLEMKKKVIDLKDRRLIELNKENHNLRCEILDMEEGGND